MTNIESLKIGDKAEIIGFGNLPKDFRRRLYGLGLYKGAEFSLAHIAPLGCPLAMQVGNTLLSLRFDEIKQLQLKIIL